MKSPLSISQGRGLAGCPGTGSVPDGGAGADSHRRREPAAALPGRQPSAAGSSRVGRSRGWRCSWGSQGRHKAAIQSVRLCRGRGAGRQTSARAPGGTGAVSPLGCPFPSSRRKLCSSPVSMANIAFPFDVIRNGVAQPADGKAGVPQEQPQTASVLCNDNSWLFPSFFLNFILFIFY